MAVRIDRCDPRRLRLLAEDRLPAAEVAALEEHLEHCDLCQAALDDIASGEPWLDAVRRYLGADPAGSYDADPGTDPETTVPPSLDLDEALGCLSASDWPDSLGRLGTYEVKGVIGRGGMGVVLKAFDPALHRNVAIKVLSPHLATCGAARKRFLREARAAAAVVHEHVVSVFSVVETAVPPYLVMEYIPGPSLQDRLDAHGPLALAEILRIAMQTASGLAAAHAQGLVHRDVKPANILLENGIERVKLTDFGLARAAADAGMTQSGVIAGTPHYMAPEQARAEATDHRADLFSLGSTIYAMCTGTPPFRAETPMAVLRRVTDDEPRPIRQLNAEIPAWLEAIVARLHAKDPADRFASASELAELLGQCLAFVQEPLTAVLPSGLIPVKKTWPDRHRRRLEIAAFVAAGIVLAMAAAYRSYRLGWLPRPRSLMGGQPAVMAPARPPGPPAARELPPSLDEPGDPFETVRQRVRAVEAELHQSADPPGPDRFSAMIQEVADRAGRFGRDLDPARDARRDVPPSSPSVVPHSPERK